MSLCVCIAYWSKGCCSIQDSSSLSNFGFLSLRRPFAKLRMRRHTSRKKAFLLASQYVLSFSQPADEEYSTDARERWPDAGTSCKLSTISFVLREREDLVVVNRVEVSAHPIGSASKVRHSARNRKMRFENEFSKKHSELLRVYSNSPTSVPPPLPTSHFSLILC